MPPVEECFFIVKYIVRDKADRHNKPTLAPLIRSMSRRFYRFESLAESLAEVLGQRESDPNLWVFEVAWEVANKGRCPCEPSN